MAICRKTYRAKSNNPHNANKNICVLAVASAFGVEYETRYLHTLSDLKRAISKRLSMRSVRSMVKGKTVGSIRNQITKLAAPTVVVVLDTHVLLMDCETGKTLVDTAPRKRDRRRIVAIYGVYSK